MPKKYILEMTQDEKLTICNALHMAYDEARRLRDQEAEMGVGQQFVFAQELHAKKLQNLFFRLVNLQATGTETEKPKTFPGRRG